MRCEIGWHRSERCKKYMKEDGWQAKKKKKRDGMNEQDEDIDERGSKGEGGGPPGEGR